MDTPNGTFSPKTDYPTKPEPQPVVFADVDGNGVQDLVVGSLRNAVSVWLSVSDTPTTVGERETQTSLVPQTPTLSQNYPNPFNPQTVIDYTLTHQSQVRLSVFNLMGQRVATLVEGHRTTGSHSVVWDGTDRDGKRLSSGVYVYRLETDGMVETRKMALVR